MRPEAEVSGYLIVLLRRRANTGVSPLRRKSAPSVEMTNVWGGVEESGRFAIPHPELCHIREGLIQDYWAGVRLMARPVMSVSPTTRVWVLGAKTPSEEPELLDLLRLRTR